MKPGKQCNCSSDSSAVWTERKWTTVKAAVISKKRNRNKNKNRLWEYQKSNRFFLSVKVSLCFSSGSLPLYTVLWNLPSLCLPILASSVDDIPKNTISQIVVNKTFYLFYHHLATLLLSMKQLMGFRRSRIQLCLPSFHWSTSEVKGMLRNLNLPHN